MEDQTEEIVGATTIVGTPTTTTVRQSGVGILTGSTKLREEITLQHGLRTNKEMKVGDATETITSKVGDATETITTVGDVNEA